jgi:hypothetical protein
MDFFTVGIREIDRGPDKGQFEIFPNFVIGRSKDLMVRGKHFYAVWDEASGLWSTDEYDVQRLVDEELARYAEEASKNGTEYKVKYLRNATNGGWYSFRKFVQNISDNSHELDSNLTFANSEVKKADYVSKRLPYPLASGDISAWDELIGTLYAPEEREKIEYHIGAVVAGDSKKIQKFVVFYGPGGTGKSTMMNCIEKLFTGYTTTFEAKALTSNNAAFATEVFKDNPLVAICHDTDLSKMEDNSKFNSIISHEGMTMNEKYKPSYTGTVNAFLFIGTNQPVKISDAKSGIIRRLIDVNPTGEKLAPNHYHALMAQIDFELGAIAHHCLEVYRSRGKNYYNNYRPLEMMYQTDIFFNFIEAYYDIFTEQNGASLKQAYHLYKEYCSQTGIERPLAQYKVREELRNYFDEFKDRHTLEDGSQVRSYYIGFNADKFKAPTAEEDRPFSLVLEETTSLFDLEFAEMPAQGSRLNEFGNEVPMYRWANVRTTLAEIDTHEVHYVKVPEKHIVIDFDLTDEDGHKSLELNLAAASEWPPTYAELSKGEHGVHLHYTFDGDVTELASVYSEGIEVKTLLGDASLRRRLTKCNNVPVATINGGLPIKEKKKVMDEQVIQSEKHLRTMIENNLQKKYNPGTKASIDFIKKLLDEAYDSGVEYNVEDMRSRIMAFANGATNQALLALHTVQKMKFKSDHNQAEEKVPGAAFGAYAATQVAASDSRNAFFDIEVFPNLFVVCWKFEDAPEKSTIKMINPSPAEIEALFKLKLIGFYNRRYDNHVLYARFLGFNNEQLYKVSQKIISGAVGSMFGEAYGLSYADIWDYSSLKQSLKKFEIDLGLRHMELNLPWDEPVRDEDIPKIVEYCVNDVLATEATHKARIADFTARLILAELSGLTPNDTTQKHTAKIIFGNDRNPQSKFVYTDLSEMFPGYKYDPYNVEQKSSYRGEDPSEGGYVYAEEGMYENVAVLDVASMHPTSIIALNAFGEYTPKFADLLNARLAIKHGRYDEARKMLDGRLEPYLKDEKQAKDLSYALKIVINIVYGLTSAKFDNPFKDPRNVDNIVAKRGALFMIELKHQCQARGMKVVHIKTDSIKVVDPTPEDIQFIMEFGEKYQYTFEHETTYKKFCLVNDAVYIAAAVIPASPDQNHNGNKDAWKLKWEAVGAQFQHPYVFKKLFSKEPIERQDLYETKQVGKGAIHIDFESVRNPDNKTKGTDGLQFIGRIGRFLPVTAESGGGILYRVAEVEGEMRRYAVSGTKGYLWMESNVAESLGNAVEVDQSYFEMLLRQAYAAIEKHGDADAFMQ